MNEETKLPTTTDAVTEQDKGRCARAPGSANRHWETALGIVATIIIAAVVIYLAFLKWNQTGSSVGFGGGLGWPFN